MARSRRANGNGRTQMPAPRAALDPQREIIKIARSAVPGNVPTGLEVGELAVDIALPPRLWVGCPTSVAAVGRLLITDGSSGGAVVSDTAPVNPLSGMLWFDAVDTQLYVWYDDGTSQQWVAASNSGGGGDGGTPGAGLGMASAGWTAGTSPHRAVFYINNTGRALTITAIHGVAEVSNGAAATVDVYYADTGTPIGSGTKVNTMSFDANASTPTLQSLGVAVATLPAGARLGLVELGTPTWTDSIAAITVYLQ